MNKFTFRFLCILMFVTILVFSGRRFTGLNNTTSAQAMIQLIPVASGLSNPLYVTSARDGSNRLFIVEQTGGVRGVMPGAAAPLQTPFSNISAKIGAGGEQGLLGLAFHPQHS